MQNFKIILKIILIVIAVSLLDTNAMSASDAVCVPEGVEFHTLSESAIARALGWVQSNEGRCGGYYLEAPFPYSDSLFNNNLIKISSDQMLFARHGMSSGEGRVTITRFGQQIVANKADIYRDPATGKINAIALTDNVMLRQPDSLIIAKTGRLDDLRAETQSFKLTQILYRTTIYSHPNKQSFTRPNNSELQKERKIYHLSAWGQAGEFKQDKPNQFELKEATYSTCPPTSQAWQVRASQINLNKDTGRGVAKNARLLIKGVPVFYSPYFNFPIDNRRQTGFLTPTVGTSSETGGKYIRTPFYWNLAPNYDTTISPAYLSTRGLQVSDFTRYLTQSSEGSLSVAALPSDQAFSTFQETSQQKYQSSTSSYTQANLRRLEDASDTRSSVVWKDNTHLNEHWSGNVDYSYVSDDYYVRNLTSNIDEVTQNQLLQQAQVTYKNTHWNFLGQVQGYQTLHPVDESVTQNQYRRLPQLSLEGDYPDQPYGLDYFVLNDVTHFNVLPTPGSNSAFPIGDRMHIQPGVSLPINLPYLYFTPRAQFALTQYQLTDVENQFPTNPRRALPILDIHSGLYFDRDIHLFHSPYRQTLEPQAYYTYVPYHNQSSIPVFDTIANTLNYDQLFIYNRFSGLDRIGDANQISVGMTTRLIDEQSGLEKVRAGIGEILYFQNRRVTLCDNADPATCTEPLSSDNRQNKSPVAGVLSYHINPSWSLTGDTIWNPQTSQLDNQTLTLHFEPAVQHIINLSYSFVRNGDIEANQPLDAASIGDLSQTDVSFAWPIARDWSTVGRWTENWNHRRFQNLLYGLQYDSCCWAVRMVMGRAFLNLNPDNNTAHYNTQFFVQFALKGLGNYGTRDPSQLLSSSVTGYQTNFGQDF